MLYGFPNAFSTFVDGNGLETVVSRIQDELQVCLELSQTQAANKPEGSTEDITSPTSSRGDIPIPYEHAMLFKGMLKFVWHILQTSGTTDRVRNLIEGPLPGVLHSIISNRKTFGATIFALAVNIFATFIHNEPQSYNILSEKDIPVAFLDAISTDVPAFSEVLAAIPNALGALCLNSGGLDLVKERNPFPRFCAIMYSQEHFRVLLDEDAASMLGHGFDELVRHHPPLKDLVMNAVIDTLKHIVHLSNDVPDDPDHYTYCLHFVQTPQEKGPVKMVEPDVKPDEPKFSFKVNCIEVASRVGYDCIMSCIHMYTSSSWRHSLRHRSTVKTFLH